MSDTIEMDKILNKYFFKDETQRDWRDYAQRCLSDKEKRYASFDYCYNYFFRRSNTPHELTDNMQLSCLQLGFYLASWGMLRGSSFLLKSSIKRYEKVIELISVNTELFHIDIDGYNDDKINMICKFKNELTSVLSVSAERDVSDTLASKIMLGVFGNVPAYDRNFKKWMSSEEKLKKHRGFNKESLLALNSYVNSLEEKMKGIKVETLDFSGNLSGIYYTNSKLLDIYGYVLGGDQIKQ